MSHFTFAEVTALQQKSSELALEELRRIGLKDLNASDGIVEFSRDIIYQLECPECGAKEERFAPVGNVRYEEGRCPADGKMRVVKTVHSYSGTEDYGKRTLDQLGLPLFDVFSVRTMDAEKVYLIAGDKSAVLGEGLAD